MKIQEQAPTKINLALNILGRRTDGYHELRMVMQSVSLCDTVTVEETGIGFALLPDGFTVPAGKSSLEQQAAEAFFAAVGRPMPPLTVHLEKTTPAYAGLGGGSADVAALLRCRGAAVFEENLFSSRYRHVDELARMGADIRVSGRTAVVLGVEPPCGVRTCVAARHCAQRLWQRRERPPFRTLPISTGAIRASRMIWRRWARIYGGWRRRPPPERQTVKENHHGKTERIGAAAQKGRQRLPL